MTEPLPAPVAHPPDAMLTLVEAPSARDLIRFQAKIYISDRTQCWLWSACRDSDGYGQMKVRRRMEKAQRISFVWLGGNLLRSDEVVRHDCDNPQCVNPGHLKKGGHVENALDRSARGRHGLWRHPEAIARGVALPQAKLDDDRVREIRRLHAAGGVSMRALGRRFGVGDTTIRRLLTRESWGHVDG